MIGFEAGTAVILIPKGSGNIRNGFLFFKFRGHDHAGIPIIAANTQNEVNIFLRKRKSEGCTRYTLRFHNIAYLLRFGQEQFQT